MTTSQRKNRARDSKRNLMRRRRIPRVFQPAASDPFRRQGRTPEQQAMTDELARAEMDTIRLTETTKQCGTCRQYLSTEANFHKDNHEASGWYRECKACRKKRSADRRERIRTMIWERTSTDVVST